MTRSQRQLSSQLVEQVVNLLLHPDLPVIGNKDHHDPSRLATFLATDAQLLTFPGKLQEKQYIMDDLQLTADYLSHPSVKTMNFAIPPSNYASALREIIRDLKPKKR